VVPCHNSMICPLVDAGGDGLQMWRVATQMLNKQYSGDDKGWPLSLEVG
jgi:hypothetical protein